MQSVNFPIAEARSYLVIFVDNLTGDKYGMYVPAVDKTHAKKLVSMQTVNTTVLSAELKEAKKEKFI